MKKYSLAIMTLLVLGVCLLCIFPSAKLDYFGSKDLLMRWCLLLFSGVFLFKDKWLKAYFVWLMICLVTQDSIQSGNRMYVLFFLILFFQILSEKLDSANIKLILNGVAVIALIHVSFVIMQKFGIKQNFYEIAPKYASSQFAGVASDTNTGGSLIALCSVVFLPLKGFRSKWWMLGLIPMAYGLFLCESLGASIATCVGLSLFVSYELNSITLKVLLIILALTLLSFYIVKKEPHRLKGNLGVRPRNCKRVWTQINHKTWGNPLKGYGLGSFRYIWRTMEEKIYKNDTGKCIGRVHNDPIEVAFNQGIIGLLLLLGVLFSNIIKFIKIKPMPCLGLLGFIGITIAVTNSLGHFLMLTPAVLLAIFYMAIMVNQTKGIKDARS